jgi:hypothetical protein
VTVSFEDLLRATLHERAADAPNGAGLLDRVHRGAERRQRRNTVRFAALAAAGVVAVIAVVAAAVALGRNRGPANEPRAPITATSAPSTTSTTPPTTAVATTQSGNSLGSVDWQSVAYPLAAGCQPNGVRVLKVDSLSPAPGVDLAAVLAQCDSGAGTPPVALYVYDGTTSSPSTPHLASTLISEKERWQANSFSTSGGDLTMNVFGFSSNNVPNCCPDVRTTLVWRWNGSSYQLVGQEPAHVTLP